MRADETTFRLVYDYYTALLRMIDQNAIQTFWAVGQLCADQCFAHVYLV